MKITALSLTAPKGTESNPKVTPELLASILARYSRSNEGIDSILAKVDLDNPDESIDRILKFVDYGHASIGGMAAGLAVTIDGITMFAAYKLFELSPMADGQESSTRYISLDASSLPDWHGLGFSEEEAQKLQAWAVKGLENYHFACSKLDAAAQANPAIVRVPDKLKNKPSAVMRLRKNYGLDRARNFLPFALKTNVGLVQSARMWTETITGLLSSGVPELVQLGNGLKEKLTPYAKNLLRHARPKAGWIQRAKDEALRSVPYIAADDLNAYSVNQEAPESCQVNISGKCSDETLAHALADRENRYDRCGTAARLTTVDCHWGEMTVAELRDLNRHRTGGRHSSLAYSGFYLSNEARSAFVDHQHMLEDWDLLTVEVLRIAHAHPELSPYTLALGAQVGFDHVTQFDKFVYTAELRTGAGAHFRYAKHYGDAVTCLRSIGFPRTADAIQVGEAEPE